MNYKQDIANVNKDLSNSYAHLNLKPHNMGSAKGYMRQVHLELSGTFIFFPSCCCAPIIDASSSTEPLLIRRNCMDAIRDGL